VKFPTVQKSNLSLLGSPLQLYSSHLIVAFWHREAARPMPIKEEDYIGQVSSSALLRHRHARLCVASKC
jgi:hypothetical protein